MSSNSSNPKPAEPGSGAMARRVVAVVALLVAVAGLSAAALMVVNPAGKVTPTAVATKPPVGTPTATKVAAATPAGSPVATAKPSTRIEHVKGNANAKVTILEYSDFQCPFCAQYATTTYPQLVEQYINTGKVKYVFRALALSNHRQAQKAAEAAECANDFGKFWEMHDLLFGRQAQWAEKGGAVELFKGYAKSLGLDETAFNTCLDSGKYASVTTDNINDARQAGVSGTPAFFINGILIPGAAPIEVFAKAIDQELAK